MIPPCDPLRPPYTMAVPRWVVFCALFVRVKNAVKRTQTRLNQCTQFLFIIYWSIKLNVLLYDRLRLQCRKALASSPNFHARFVRVKIAVKIIPPAPCLLSGSDGLPPFQCQDYASFLPDIFPNLYIMYLIIFNRARKEKWANHTSMVLATPFTKALTLDL